ncbi:MAG: VanZ family protein [Bifidobacteriaceae bacterium]|jgi:hypothetical protein|nr:VanZ family protein [Bifidobacteriaceae bacterium]
MAKTVSTRRTLTAVAWLALAAQLVTLYAPEAPGSGALSFPGADKLVHAAVFGFAVWAWSRRYPQWGWLVLIIFAAHAAISELIQGQFLADRSADPWDAIADLVGVALGFFLARLPAPQPRPSDPLPPEPL